MTDTIIGKEGRIVLSRKDSSFFHIRSTVSGRRRLTLRRPEQESGSVPEAKGSELETNCQRKSWNPTENS